MMSTMSPSHSSGSLLSSQEYFTSTEVRSAATNWTYDPVGQQLYVEDESHSYKLQRNVGGSIASKEWTKLSQTPKNPRGTE